MQKIKYKLKSTGETKWRYKYYREGKHVTVPQKSLPYIPKSEAQAEALRKQLEADYEAEKVEERQLSEWHEKYYSFRELFNQFEIYRKRVAKNSWKDKLSYFNNYVLHFFLEIKEAENLNLWANHREEFKNWLTTREKKRGTGNLSTQTMNHIFTEYNCFIDLMYSKGKCKNNLKIDLYEKSELNERNADDLITLEEYEFIRSQLEGVWQDFYTILYWTGMRINELYSMSLADVHRNQIPHEQLRQLLEAVFKEKPKCYFLLKHQLKDRKKISFKPLKSKKKINEKNTRYVPIYNTDAFNALAKYVRKQREEFKNGTPADRCMLFLGEFNLDKLNGRIQKAYEGSNLYQYKSAHLTRHAYATYLGGKDLSGVIQKLVLGHNEQTAARYNHLHETLVRKMANKENSAAYDDEWDDIA